MEVQAATRIIEWVSNLGRAGGLNGEPKEMLPHLQASQDGSMLPSFVALSKIELAFGKILGSQGIELAGQKGG